MCRFFRVKDLVRLGRLPFQRGLGRETGADREAVGNALAATECTAFADRPIDALSGGERQRAVLARALAQTPQLLLCDEPTAHLDLRHQIACLRLLAGLRNANGLTIVAALHDINIAARYCDRILLLHAGHLIEAGAPVEVLTPATLATVYGVSIWQGRDAEGSPFYAPRT